MNKKLLLDELIKDEKKVNKILYSSGPYWQYANKRAILEIKKKGLKDFRGSNNSLASSFADNLPLDIRDEFNIKGRIVGKILSFPLLSKIFNGQLYITKDYLNLFIKNQSVVYQNNSKKVQIREYYKFWVRSII
jgi:hypothetical protein